MTGTPRTVLVVGATGSIGRLVVAEAIGQDYTPTRALVRDPRKGLQLPEDEPRRVRDDRDAVADTRSRNATSQAPREEQP